MDMEKWAKFLRDFGLLITVFAGLVGILIKALLDRDSTAENRQYAQREKKIAEAKELVNTYNQVTREILTIRVSLNTEIALIEHNLSSSRIAETSANFRRIEELLNISPERLKSISGLRDDKLIKLHEKFRKEIYIERGKLDKLKTKITRKEPINPKQDMVETALLADRFGSIISTMYDLIEKIANKEP
jgi:hypothetical protein